MSKRLIGYGYTNANGVATLDYDAEGNELQSSGYVGQGVGNVDISASAVIDGSTFVSETYTVLDTWKKDVDKSLDNWVYNLTNYNFEIKEDYAELKEISGGLTNACLRIKFNIPLGNCIEFEAKVDGVNTNEFARWIQDNTAMTGIKLSNFGANVNEWYKFQLKFNSNGTVTCIANNQTYNAPATSFDSSKEYIQFLFCTASQITTIQFRNMHIYPF